MADAVPVNMLVRDGSRQLRIRPEDGAGGTTMVKGAGLLYVEERQAAGYADIGEGAEFAYIGEGAGLADMEYGMPCPT